MKPWFRFYNEVVDDPKVQRLSGDLFKVWVNFLCLASKHDGVLPSTEDLAFSLRVSEDEISTFRNQLMIAGLFDEKRGMVVPHGWDKRQFKSDLSTSRVKRFRKRSKPVSRNGPEQTRTEQTPIVPESGFEKFWNAYPRKVGKTAAMKRWVVIEPSEELVGKMLAAIEAWKQSDQWRKNDGQYVPYPVTWLNQERWNDQVAVEKLPPKIKAVQVAL